MEVININTVPMIDNIIMYLKDIMLNCTIKNPKYSEMYENQMSLKTSSMYLSILDKTASFSSFSYTYFDFYKSCKDFLHEDEIIKYFNNKETIPENIKSLIFNDYKKSFIDSYIEINEYYRELLGLCKFDRSNVVYLTEDDIGDLENIDISIPVHEMDISIQDTLNAFRITDRLYNRYGYKYLKYIGSRRKIIYDIRTAPDYSLLGIESEAPVELISRFKERYNINREYIMKNVYSDAFKLESEYYEEFIIMLILTQTTSDILSEIPDIINKREMFDLKTIKLFFNSIGVKYFPKIPYKYQILMVKNFHKLITNKSTTKSIIDILQLFNVKNINIFKYYLIKRRNLDVDNNFIDTGDIERDFKLEFLKCPIDGNIDEYIHDDKNFMEYHDIVGGDIYWNGDLEYDKNKMDHLLKEFNYVESKYLSIDVMNSVNEMNFHIIYLYNMMYDSKLLEEKLVVPIPYLSSNHLFKFVDILSFLTSLSYEYHGFEDTVMELPEHVLYIKGFNFEADMSKILNMLNNNKMTWDDLGITEFIKSDSDVITYKQLIHILNNNILTLKGLTKCMNNAENKKIYDIYKTIYESLYIIELNDKFYKNTIGYYPKTHREFLSKRDAILYENILRISQIEDEDAKKEQISLIIEYVVFSLQTTIPDLDFTYIFKGIPTVSAEAIQEYILYVINFYKSFKSQILSINTMMNFDDLLENKVRIVDDIKYKVMLFFKDFLEIYEKIKVTVDKKIKDKINVDETLYIKYIYGEIDKYFDEYIKVTCRLNLFAYTNKKDNIHIYDDVKIVRKE